MKELFESSYLSVMTNENMKLREELQRKDNMINELKEIYIKTCNHLFEIGNDELARYLKAQIDENNTFFVGKM